jgi:hypothetical protein
MNEGCRPLWLARWLERHQHPASFALHAVGIPLAIAAVVMAGVQFSRGHWDLWWRPAGLLVVGYLLQWIGHHIEGNDMGEIILLKRWLGRPYIGVSERYAGKNQVGRDSPSSDEPERI